MTRESKPGRSRPAVRTSGSHLRNSAPRIAPWACCEGSNRPKEHSPIAFRQEKRLSSDERRSASGAIAILAFVITAVFAAPLEAASLRGRILDPQGAAVANVRLRLFDRNGGTVRNARSRDDGTYSFPNLSSNEYLLEGETSDASLAGSRALEVDGDTTLDLDLSVSASTVEIFVTASSTPVARDEVAKALDAVDDEEIALRDEFSLAEAIRNTPGVRVQQLRGPGSFVSIQTRGLRTHDTALLVDGMRFRDSASTQGDATAFYQDLSLVDTDRVEFLRGTGSSLYGSHAIGGVINVNTHQGGGRPHGEIRAEGGGLGMLRGVARAGGGLAEERFQYSGGFSHLNVTRGYRGASPYRNSSAQGWSRYSFRPNLSLSGRVWAADSFRSLVESPTFPTEVVANFPATGSVPAIALPVSQLTLFERGEPYGVGNATFVPDQIDPDGRNSSAFLVTAFTLRHDVSPSSSFQLSYQSVGTGRRYQDGPGGPGSYDPAVSNDARYDGETHTVLARTDHRVGKSHLASIGFEFESESYSNFNTDESPSPVESSTGIDQASHAVFVQDQIRLLEGSLHINLSGRAQRFILGSARYSGAAGPYANTSDNPPRSSYTGDAAVGYFFRSSGTKLRSHVGNGFRAPSLYERFGGSFSSYAGSFNYWGDPHLNPERSLAADFGIDQWLLDTSVRLSATYFYTNLAETIVFDFANFPANDAFGRFGGYRNSGGGIARGVEVSAQVAPSSSTIVRGSYTYANSESRTPTIGPDFFQIPGLSAHVYTATATQWIGKRVNVTFDLFGASDYILSPFGAQGRRLVFDGPVKGDIVFRYDVPLGDGKRLEFYGKVENVFNHDYYEDGFGSPGAWAIGGLRFKF